ncbi:MAG: hypothetical protein IJX09_03460 [Clostridia bacterium]|nr:hypothetical protein [Clostridia bacterium]
MKKAYFEIELEVVMLTEDIVSTSTPISFGDGNDLNNPNEDTWWWN